MTAFSDIQNTQRADCHCHSLHSDGSLSPSALLDLAFDRGLTGLSITDHDTLCAYTTAVPYAKQLGISLVSGIEISTQYQRNSVHVLGYAFDLNHEELHAFCRKLQCARENRNIKILERLAHYKVPITMSELKSRFPEGTLGRPHMAKLLVEKGYVNSMQAAFKRFLGNKSCCYVPGFEVEVPEAIELIQRAGGYAVLAHPHYLQPQRMLPSLCAMPFDGIEIYYGQMTAIQQKPWLDIANKKGWLTTGGSDFHGAKKAYQSLGCAWTPVEVFALFEQRYAKY